MIPALLLTLLAITVCALVLVAAGQHITNLRDRADGWRRIALELAAELRGGY
jgi:hypothetical protein